MTILWSVLSLGLSITFLIVQGTLLLIFVGLSTAITALSAWADQRDPDAAVPGPAAKRRGSANPRGNAGSRRSAAAVPNCTRTGKPTNQCGCAEKHVVSERGARRYKQPIGTPRREGGRGPRRLPGEPAPLPVPKVPKVKEPRVPTTNRAKPIRQKPGETMWRVS